MGDANVPPERVIAANGGILLLEDARDRRDNLVKGGLRHAAVRQTDHS